MKRKSSDSIKMKDNPASLLTYECSLKQHFIFKCQKVFLVFNKKRAETRNENPPPVCTVICRQILIWHFSFLIFNDNVPEGLWPDYQSGKFRFNHGWGLMIKITPRRVLIKTLRDRTGYNKGNTSTKKHPPKEKMLLSWPWSTVKQMSNNIMSSHTECSLDIIKFRSFFTSSQATSQFFFFLLYLASEITSSGMREKFVHFLLNPINECKQFQLAWFNSLSSAPQDSQCFVVKS